MRSDSSDEGSDAAEAGDSGDAPDSVGPPEPPSDVAAADGESPDHVTISWSAVPGADSYRVLRDDVEIAAGLPANAYTDNDAQSRPPTAAGFDLSASSGTYSEFVRLSWSPPAVPTGVVHQYRVVAENEAGRSAPSAPDLGYRAPAPISGYEVSVNESEWTGVGSATTFEDVSAAAGRLVSAGQAQGSDGADPCAVSLDLLELATVSGPSSDYRVRALNDGGAGPPSQSVTGNRAEPVLLVQWQRSVDETAASFEDIVGATTSTYQDVSGPIDESVRIYRAQVTPAGGDAVVSGQDEGHRSAPRLVGDSERLDNFGWSVALSEDRLLVGAPAEDFTGNPGRAYAFRWSPANGWTPDGVLAGDDTAIDDYFGNSVSISGSRALVGAPFHHHATEQADWPEGSAYVFRRQVGGWAQEAETVGAGGRVDEADWFGYSVAIDTDRTVLGSPHADLADVGSGGGHVLLWDGEEWNLEDDLLPNDPMGGDHFGWSVSLDGDRAVLGSEASDALVFQRSGFAWEVDGRLERPSALVGRHVALSGDWATVGGFDGSVDAFRRDTSGWTFDSRLTPDDDPGTSFGGAIAMDGAWLIVGAPGDDARGSAYVFHNDGESWQATHRVIDVAGGEPGAFFGLSVAVNGAWAAVGSASWDGSRGAVVLFCLPPAP